MNPFLKNLYIRQPEKKDENEIHQIFSIVINDAFDKEPNFSDPQEIVDEIRNQKNKLELFFSSSGEEEYFLLTEYENQIIGTLSFGKPSDIIIKEIGKEAINSPALKSAYVLPKFQSRGVVKMLFFEIIKEIKRRGHSQFYFDCGYALAQSYYLKLFGEPEVFLPHCWGQNCHHRIWKCRVNDYLLK